MKIIRNTITISDLIKWYDEGVLKINKEYQREKGLWPINARSFFIDTILNGFPFPKLIIRQMIDLKTNKNYREIIDGQQRFLSIYDFFHDKMTLSKVSKTFFNYKYSDLADENKNDFLTYEVSVDSSISITDDEVVEVFRRINSYMLPLNEPEKRHAAYQGEFKWFIKDTIEKFTPLFEQYKILSQREISRMYDADLLTEICLVLITKKIGSRSSPKLEELYKKYDLNFEIKNDIDVKLSETLNFIKVDLNEICKSELLSGVTFYSLFNALLCNKWGLNFSSEELNQEFAPIGCYTNNTGSSIQKILEMLNALEKSEHTGQYSDFVRACTKTTSSINSRLERHKWFMKCLN